MGKNKLSRWAELNTFRNVIQPEISDVSGTDHSIKGNWNKKVFGNGNPVVLELGCGKGEYTIELSKIFPERNFIGVDIKGARMWRGAKTAMEHQFRNVAFLRTRIEFISSFFSEKEVDEIWMTFPDPQPGKKNSNKRLTCPWFLNKYNILLRENGIIHLKTDNIEFYNYTKRLIIKNSLELLFSTDDLYSLKSDEFVVFTRLFSSGGNTLNPSEIADRVYSVRTHYEKKFLKEGSKICFLTFRLEKNKQIQDGWEGKG